MALGLIAAAALLLAWPLLLVTALIRSMPWGGEREFSLVVLVACVLLSFAAVSPGVFAALDRTSIAALSALLDLRAAAGAWQINGIFSLFDGLRAAPFLFGSRELASQIWVLDTILIVVTVIVFAGGARIGGLFGGAAAAVMIVLEANLRVEFRTFDAVPALLLGAATTFLVLLSTPHLRYKRWGIVLAALLGGLTVGCACGSGAAARVVPLVAGKTSVLPYAVIALFGGVAGRWWMRGLRAEYIGWRGFKIGTYLLAALGAALASETVVLGGPTVLTYLAAVALTSILAGGVLGGFCRLMGVHVLVAPALVIGIAVIRLWFFPFDPQRAGGFASTVDDLRAVVPSQTELATSINPKLAREFLDRPSRSIRSVLDREPPEPGDLLMIETRFSPRDEIAEIEQRFRLVPVLPGISRAYNLKEASAGPNASE